MVGYLLSYKVILRCVGVDERCFTQISYMVKELKEI